LKLLGDPAIDGRRQDIEGDCAITEHHAMKVADVEGVAESVLCDVA
jgi:hypothetical protein